MSRIILIGAGNVATRLGLALVAAGHHIEGVCSRGSQSGRDLADLLGCRAIERIADTPAGCDMVLIATGDAAVAEVAAALPASGYVVAHTSGSVPIEVLARHHRHAAVLYPLQTFSKDVEVDISKVPFFTEASDDTAWQMVDDVARSLSHTVSHADSAVRSRLHVAGVLSCNFPVYLLDITRRVLADVGLPLDVVAPLVEATMCKTFDVGPLKAMTGPARRGDIDVVKRQLNSLALETDRNIYRALSQAILKEFHPDISSEL